MKSIVLTRGYTTSVDDEDFPYLDQFNWHVTMSPGGVGIYVAGRLGGGSLVYMHRVILAAPKGVTVDHIDGDGLNNVRSNLRFATQAEQNGNSIRYSQLGVKGVSQTPNGRYRAQICRQGKIYSLGTYATIEAASKAYDDAARAYFGDFALTNDG